MTYSRPISATMTATLIIAASPAAAASEAELDTLFEALGTPRLIEIMREEGIATSMESVGELFGPQGSGFRDLASRVYDTDRMESTFRVEFDDILSDVDIEPLLKFFASDRGRQIISLELSAREALGDAEVEAVAERAAEALPNEDPARWALLEEFVATNDLIDLNVMGTMNASVAYYQGLIEAGEGDVTEDQILADVWGQEPEIRDDTTTWVYAYLGMAYEPLTNDDITAYIEMSESPAGRALNRALFDGFGVVFEEISYLLGRATVTFGQSEEL